MIPLTDNDYSVATVLGPAARDCLVLPCTSKHNGVHPAPPSSDYLARQKQRIDVIRDALSGVAALRDRITLEIGSGHGHYLTGYAAAHPDKICVGIDIMLDRHARSEKKRTRARLDNLVFLRAAAEDFLPAMPPALLLDDIFVLFPDPWPKRRHHKNRLIQNAFLDALSLRSEVGARLCFRTDHEEYFKTAKETVAAHPRWKLEPSAPWPFELKTVFQSRAPTYQSFVARRLEAAAAPGAARA